MKPVSRDNVHILIEVAIFALLVFTIIFNVGYNNRVNVLLKSVDAYTEANRSVMDSKRDWGLKMLELGYACRAVGDTVAKCKRDITIVLDGKDQQ